MLSFENAALYLDELVDSLPQTLLRSLNGGVSLVPDCKLSSAENGLYVLGQYFKSKQMGRYIFIYYGSFLKLYRHKDDEYWKKHLKEVLTHELTHHNQSLAGVHDLEVKDTIQRIKYETTGVYTPTKDIELYKKDT